MISFRVAVLAALVFILSTPRVRADLPAPLPDSKNVKFVVEVDEKATSPKLIVPINIANTPRPPKGPWVDPRQGKDPLSSLGSKTESGSNATAAHHRSRIIVAAVAFTLALAIGGISLIRRGFCTSTRNMAVLVTVGSTLAATTLVWANSDAPNIVPPPEKITIPRLPISFEGKISVVYGDEGDTITLVLDKKTYKAVKKDLKKPEGK